MKNLQRTLVPVCSLLFLALFVFTANHVWQHETESERNPNTPISEKNDEATQQKVFENYGKLPMHFEANDGQFDEQVKSLTNVAKITPEQAKAIAVNDLEQTEEGVHLRNRRHEANFTAEGVHFVPRRGKLDWRWQLTHIGADEAPLATVELGAVTPVKDQAGNITYDRGGVVEQYLPKAATVEQQFVIPEPLALAGADLVVTGRVQSAGEFAATNEGWVWATEAGVVSLGGVTVFDAQGKELPATMQATDTETRIEVDGASLALASYPVTIDPEIGANDFRISDAGGSGSAVASAFDPAVAYNSVNNEYLVVWRADDTDAAGVVNGEFEIFGQRLAAATGAEVGANDFRISDAGGSGNAALDAFQPAVAYNSTNNEYLVVWTADDTDAAGVVDNEFEIFGQRLAAATGAEVGANDFRISDAGGSGNADLEAFEPAVAYSITDNEYKVVWEADDTDATGVVDDEFEIFSQRLDAATGAEVGTNDERLSDAGGSGSTAAFAGFPAVAYNSTNNEYLVVWTADDTDAAGVVGGEFEIFGQRCGLGVVVPHDFVLLAEEDIQINGQFNSDGDIHANNDIFFNEGNKPNSIHTGNVTASDDIVIKKKNKIMGTVKGDEVENDGTVTGGVTENAGIAKVPLPVLASIEPGDDDVTVKKGKTLTLDPGDYEEVKVEKKGTLKLKSGTYNLECLNLGEKAVLVIDLSSGDPIILNVDEEVIFGKNAVMILTPSTAATTLITINCDEDDDSDQDFDDDEDDTDRVIIGEGARVFGTIIAPETMVVLDKKSRFKGAICAENILVLKGARFVHHSSMATFPKESEVEESEVTQSEVITDYVLEQNYPNPFNPSTKISFALPEAGMVKLQIYNLLGNEVKTLVNEHRNAGPYDLIWNGRNRAGEVVAAGVYLYRLTVERNGEAPVVMTRKLTVLK